MINKMRILKSFPLANTLATKFSISKFSTNSSQNFYDIIITGGGLIGTTLACTLGKNPKFSDKNILLLEASKEHNWSLSEKYSNRVVSLNPATKKLLTEIDAWKHIDSARFTTVKRLQVWDAISDASITFGEETSTDDVSYIVENGLIIDSVSKELKTIQNVDVLYETKVKSYDLPDHKEENVNICLEDGSNYKCELLVTSRGIPSECGDMLKIKLLNRNSGEEQR